MFKKVNLIIKQISDNIKESFNELRFKKSEVDNHWNKFESCFDNVLKNNNIDIADKSLEEKIMVAYMLIYNFQDAEVKIDKENYKVDITGTYQNPIDKIFVTMEINEEVNK